MRFWRITTAVAVARSPGMMIVTNIVNTKPVLMFARKTSVKIASNTVEPFGRNRIAKMGGTEANAVKTQTR